MGVCLVLSLTIFWSACRAQNNTVRYEPLRNKDINAEFEAWLKGPEYYVRDLGLSFEWLETSAEDNVTLRIHHIWNPRVNGTRIPVLLLPSLASTGDIFLISRPEENFMLTLANQGYDVFMANHRASKYSPLSQQKFDTTTLDGLTFLDVAPVFDKVLEYTNQPKVHLIGFSRGTTIALLFLAERVEYNEKVRLLFLICPITYIENPQPALGFMMVLTKVLSVIGGKRLASLYDTNFFLIPLHSAPTPEIIQFLAEHVPIIPTCVENFILTGRLDCFTRTNIDTHIIKKVLTRGFPDQLDLRELIQYAENTMAKVFQSYSPAWLDRDLIPVLFNTFPGTREYDMSKVTCPVAILQANTDLFSQPEDYKRIREQLCSRIITGKLSPGKYVFQVKTPNYMHSDPAIGRNNDRIFGNAFYRIMRELDISQDESLQNVLGYIDADFSNLVPQSCE